MTNICDMPEDCLEQILFWCSPEDILRFAAASKQCYSVAVSDDFWKKLLPSDYDLIIKESSSLPQFNSLKDLFFLLYRSHILIDDSKKSFRLDRRHRKKCYMLGARSLMIVWGDTPRYWTWKFKPESRFPENAQLRLVCWLEIKGEIPVKWLSPHTTYGAYFVFKLTPRHHGLEGMPLNVSVEERDEDGHHPLATNVVCLTAQSGLPGPSERDDGWMEIQIGIYQVAFDGEEGGDHVLKLSVYQYDSQWGHGKCGLLVEGIELRPLD